MKPQRKIAVELLEIGNRNVGFGEFTYQLGAHLAARAAALRQEHGIGFYFIVPRGFKGCFGPDVSYIQTFRPIRKLLRFYPERMDLFHVTHQFSRIKYMFFARRNLLTIHDINFFYEKSACKLPRYVRAFRLRLAHADDLVYISQFARADVGKHFAPKQPDRVIYNGVADFSRNASASVDLSSFGLPEHFLLHISSLQPKKNVHLLVEMMASLPEENLVIVGNWHSGYGRRLRERIDREGLKNIFPLDHVTDAEKFALYERCKGFCFPSLCEGFGLPPVEAMKAGKPVFLSTLTSLPEVGGDCACYYSELTPAAMASATRRGLDDFAADPVQASERIRGWAGRFNWEKCADEYIACYLDLLDKNNG